MPAGAALSSRSAVASHSVCSPVVGEGRLLSFLVDHDEGAVAEVRPAVVKEDRGECGRGAGRGRHPGEVPQGPHQRPDSRALLAGPARWSGR